MSVESRPQVLVSNMSMPYFAGLPVEITGLIATKYMKSDGVEYVPTKVGVIQVNRHAISGNTEIQAAHWNWRGEPSGIAGAKIVWEARKEGFGKLGASLYTWALMPMVETTRAHLSKMEQVLNHRLPVVLYLEFLDEQKINELDFVDKSVQITPYFLERRKIRSAEQLEDKAAEWGITPCVDTIHSGGINKEVLKKALSLAREIHVGINRTDLTGVRSNLGLEILDHTQNLKRIVVEAGFATPMTIKKVVGEIKERIR